MWEKIPTQINVVENSITFGSEFGEYFVNGNEQRCWWGVTIEAFGETGENGGDDSSHDHLPTSLWVLSQLIQTLHQMLTCCLIRTVLNQNHKSTKQLFKTNRYISVARALKFQSL